MKNRMLMIKESEIEGAFHKLINKLPLELDLTRGDHEYEAEIAINDCISDLKKKAVEIKEPDYEVDAMAYEIDTLRFPIKYATNNTRVNIQIRVLEDKKGEVIEDEEYLVFNSVKGLIDYLEKPEVEDKE